MLHSPTASGPSWQRRADSIGHTPHYIPNFDVKSNTLSVQHRLPVTPALPTFGEERARGSNNRTHTRSHSHALPSKMANTLGFLDSLLFRNLGVILEGETFLVLSKCPSIVRAFEYGLADGAVDCSQLRDITTTFADRFWDLCGQAPFESSDCGLIELKSTFALESGAQRYAATVGQARRVCFYICRCSADPNFVEIIPNMRQEPAALHPNTEQDKGDGQLETVNVARVSRLWADAHGLLNQCGTPFRIPLVQLPQTIEGLRRHLQGLEDFVLPWSKVTLPKWKPTTTTKGLKWLKPSEGTANFSAYLETTRLNRAVQRTDNFGLDFIGIQPCLADFSLQLRRLVGQHKLCFVQFKLESRMRALTAVLDQVSICRDDRYYFDCCERFDYLLYLFEFTKDGTVRKILFLPEKLLPDHFYTTLERNGDFTNPAFEPYFINLDNGISWLGRVAEIIDANPHPRSVAPRPVRVHVPKEKKTQPKNTSAPPPKAGRKPGGRAAYKKAMLDAHRNYFYGVIEQCVER